jgi:hypothetical protein
MSLVKAWQEKSNEPKKVLDSLGYDDTAYIYEATIYLGVGGEYSNCLTGIRLDIYKGVMPSIKSAIVVRILNNIRGYMILQTRELIFDLNGDGKFKKIEKFTTKTCFKDWDYKKFKSIME